MLALMALQSTPRAVPVRLRPGEKPVYFDAGELTLREGDLAVVESSHGPDVGVVTRPPCALVHRDAMTALAPVLRAANEADRTHSEQAPQREQAVLGQAKDALRGMGLPIKLSRARMGLGERRAVIEFTSTGQADLRAVYQRLREAVPVRVELRSLGPRDEAKVLGGLGRCGGVICCARWMNRFDPVTVKMPRSRHCPSAPRAWRASAGVSSAACGSSTSSTGRRTARCPRSARACSPPTAPAACWWATPCGRACRWRWTGAGRASSPAPSRFPWPA
jgi:cell fate regulator YaaT (PSP1 superfamily)